MTNNKGVASNNMAMNSWDVVFIQKFLLANSQLNRERNVGGASTWEHQFVWLNDMLAKLSKPRVLDHAQVIDPFTFSKYFFECVLGLFSSEKKTATAKRTKRDDSSSAGFLEDDYSSDYSYDEDYDENVSHLDSNSAPPLLPQDKKTRKRGEGFVGTKVQVNVPTSSYMASFSLFLVGHTLTATTDEEGTTCRLDKYDITKQIYFDCQSQQSKSIKVKRTHNFAALSLYQTRIDKLRVKYAPKESNSSISSTKTHTSESLTFVLFENDKLFPCLKKQQKAIAETENETTTTITIDDNINNLAGQLRPLPKTPDLSSTLPNPFDLTTRDQPNNNNQQITSQSMAVFSSSIKSKKKLAKNLTVSFDLDVEIAIPSRIRNLLKLIHARLMNKTRDVAIQRLRDLNHTRLQSNNTSTTTSSSTLSSNSRGNRNRQNETHIHDMRDIYPRYTNLSSSPFSFSSTQNNLFDRIFHPNKANSYYANKLDAFVSEPEQSLLNAYYHAIDNNRNNNQTSSSNKTVNVDSLTSEFENKYDSFLVSNVKHMSAFRYETLANQWLNVDWYELVHARAEMVGGSVIEWTNDTTNSSGCELDSLRFNADRTNLADKFRVFGRIVCSSLNFTKHNEAQFLSLRHKKNDRKEEKNVKSNSNSVLEMIDEYARLFELELVAPFVDHHHNYDQQHFENSSSVSNWWSRATHAYRPFHFRIVYFSACIAVSLLTACWLIYFCLGARRSLQMPRSFVHIHVNLWLCVVSLCSTWVLGIHQVEQLEWLWPRVCWISGVWLHYLTLATLVWHALFFYALFDKLHTLKKRNFDLIFSPDDEGENDENKVVEDDDERAINNRTMRARNLARLFGHRSNNNCNDDEERLTERPPVPLPRKSLRVGNVNPNPNANTITITKNAAINVNENASQAETADTGATTTTNASSELPDEADAYLAKPVIHYYMLGWGVPALLVSVIVSITKRDYIGVPYDVCFTNNVNILVGSLAVPAGILLLVCVACICLVGAEIHSIMSDLQLDEYLLEKNGGSDGDEDGNNNNNELDVDEEIQHEKAELCQRWTAAAAAEKYNDEHDDDDLGGTGQIEIKMNRVTRPTNNKFDAQSQKSQMLENDANNVVVAGCEDDQSELMDGVSAYAFGTFDGDDFHRAGSDQTSVMDVQHKPQVQLKLAICSFLTLLGAWLCALLLVIFPFPAEDHPYEHSAFLVNKVLSYLWSVCTLAYGFLQFSFYVLAREDVTFAVWRPFMYRLKQSPLLGLFSASRKEYDKKAAQLRAKIRIEDAVDGVYGIQQHQQQLQQHQQKLMVELPPSESNDNGDQNELYEECKVGNITKKIVGGEEEEDDNDENENLKESICDTLFSATATTFNESQMTMAHQQMQMQTTLATMATPGSTSMLIDKCGYRKVSTACKLKQQPPSVPRGVINRLNLSDINNTTRGSRNASGLDINTFCNDNSNMCATLAIPEEEDESRSQSIMTSSQPSQPQSESQHAENNKSKKNVKDDVKEKKQYHVRNHQIINYNHEDFYLTPTAEPIYEESSTNDDKNKNRKKKTNKNNKEVISKREEEGMKRAASSTKVESSQQRKKKKALYVSVDQSSSLSSLQTTTKAPSSSSSSSSASSASASQLIKSSKTAIVKSTSPSAVSSSSASALASGASAAIPPKLNNINDEDLMLLKLDSCSAQTGSVIVSSLTANSNAVSLTATTLTSGTTNTNQNSGGSNSSSSAMVVTSSSSSSSAAASAPSSSSSSASSTMNRGLPPSYSNKKNTIQSNNYSSMVRRVGQPHQQQVVYEKRTSVFPASGCVSGGNSNIRISGSRLIKTNSMANTNNETSV